MPEGGLTVREMLLPEVDLRIEYFHDSTDQHLQMLGVDRALLLAPDEWRAWYQDDYARPLPERRNYSLIWERDGTPIGFSSTDRIVFGQEAFMHQHILNDEDRRHGCGTELVKRSARIYLEVFELQRLYCEPNALNTAPNRTLQSAGFRFVFSHLTVPGPFNHPQVVTRWVLEPSRC
jgi:RimJ/RimL family protein N-acetyltransferase